MKMIEKIRQKIEELYNGEAPKHDPQCNFNDGYFTGIDAIAQFIDTLESEKPMNQEGLEEEYKDYVESDPVYSKLVNRNAGLGIARHFAQWGAEHKQKNEQFPPLEGLDAIKAKYYDDGFKNGFDEGVVEGKRLMMEEVVEGEYDQYPAAIYLPTPIPKMNKGDKVKIIIVKED